VGQCPTWRSPCRT